MCACALARLAGMANVDIAASFYTCPGNILLLYIPRFGRYQVEEEI